MMANEKDEDEKVKPKRSIWVRPLLQQRDSSDVFNDLSAMLRESIPGSLKNFVRMDAADFDSLVEVVTPLIKKQDTSFRKAITPSERLAVTLRYLATGESFATLEQVFRISKSSIFSIVEETCDALYHGLKDNHLKFPSTNQDWENIAAEFQDRCNFPHCCGALDGRHISIKAPNNCGSEYYNYKKFNSIVFMALADAKYRFTFVDVGAFGRESDSGVFEGCALSEKLKLPPPQPMSSTKIMPFCIVADDAFPLKPYIMKSFARSKLTMPQRVFNYRLSRARRIIENVFGLCAARFRVLQALKTSELAPAKVVKVVLAACVLHNYLIDRNSVYSSSSDFDHERSDGSIVEGRWRQDVSMELTRLKAVISGGTTKNAEYIRDKWMNYFVGRGEVDWQYNAVAANMSNSQNLCDNSWRSAPSKRNRNRALTTPWTKTQASKLVLLIEAEHRLWYKFHPEYKNFKASRLVWDKIAELMERKTDDCVNKWGSLRSNFKARCVDKTKSLGEEPTLEDMPEPYCHMGFLMDVIQDKSAMHLCSMANEATDTSSISEANDEVLVEESFEVLETKAEIVDVLYQSTMSSPPTPPTPKRCRLEMANQPVTSMLQTEAMVGAAFERMMKPADEWDKMTQVLAEYMRNAVSEFPHLADRFRVQLLELSLDVQKERVNARAEAADAMGLNIDFKTFNLPDDNGPI